MLHLEIQKGKEAMKTSKFQNFMGGTAACMRRLDIATKGCGQLTSNYTYFADICFIYIKNYKDMAAAGSIIVGQQRRATRGFVYLR